MKAFYQVLKMDLKNLFTNPVIIGFNTVFIALIILILGFLTNANYANPKTSYHYYLVSFLVFSALNGSMTATNIFMERDIKEPNLRIIFSPVGSFTVYFSKIISSFIFNFIAHISVIGIISYFLELSLGEHPLLLLSLMIALELCCAALGIFFCCVFRNEESASMVLSNIVSILAVLGGTFFSLERFGKVFSIATNLSPAKWINDSFFMLVFDNNVSRFYPSLIGTTIAFLLLVLGCKVLFKTEDYL